MSHFRESVAASAAGGGHHSSEEGQLHSPYNSDEGDTADSLEIKPPQAASSSIKSYKERRSGKDKKHSREHRHKTAHQPSGDKDRDRMRGDREDRKHRRRDRNAMHDPQQRHDSSMRSSRDHHKKKERRTHDLNIDDRNNQMLQDLRSRLLHKRNRSQGEGGKSYDDSYEYYEETGYDQTKSQYNNKNNKVAPYREMEEMDYQYEQAQVSRIELNESLHKKVGADSHVDHESIRTRFLEANREAEKRKRHAAEELLARRQKRRGGVADGSPVQYSLDNNCDIKKKLKLNGDFDEDDHDDVVQISDDSENDTESDTAGSNSDTSNSDDIDLPASPLSVEKLSKSEHRQRHSSRSASGSVTPVHSRSRSHSMSPSKSRSQSKSPVSDKSLTRSSDSENEQGDNKDEEAVAKLEEKNDQVKSKDSTNYESDDNKKSDSEDLPNYYPGIQGCRSVEEFQCLNRIEEGTYGVVYRAKDKRTEQIVALKRLKMEKEKEGFPITSLREINTLLKGQHPNIVTVREIVVGSNMDKIFIVMDYVEHDLKSLMETMKHKKQSFLPGEVKCLTQQLLRAVAHLHDNWILHRDLKTSNLLLSHKGVLKVGDFGLAREYGSPLKAYTSIVVTLWYRAPELLLCCKEYACPIDMWSVGCIFAEFLAMGALFPGKSEIDQLNRIFKDLGTPNEKIWPGYKELPAVQKMTFTEYPVSNLRKKFLPLTSEMGLSLLQGMLTYDPKQRLTADLALEHNYFKEQPLPIDPAMFPTWPAKSELGARKALASSPKPPSGGSQFKQLREEPADNHGFILGGAGPGFNLKF